MAIGRGRGYPLPQNFVAGFVKISEVTLIVGWEHLKSGPQVNLASYACASKCAFRPVYPPRPADEAYSALQDA